MFCIVIVYYLHMLPVILQLTMSFIFSWTVTNKFVFGYLYNHPEETAKSLKVVSHTNLFDHFALYGMLEFLSFCSLNLFALH